VGAAENGGPLRVASFGAGWVTCNRHIPAMRSVGGYEIALLADRRAERARAAAADLGVPASEGTIELDGERHGADVDAITCGTAPFAHHQVVRSALEAGKHAITDKPFTMTVAEGEELVELAGRRGLVLAVVHNFQFSRSVRELRSWIASGRVGRPRGIWAAQLSNPRRRLPSWYEELPLGLFYDESPHLIYLAKALAPGPLERLSATIYPSTLGKPTPAQMNLLLSSEGIPVTLEMNFEAPVSEWHLAVLGEEGLGVVDLFRDIAVFAPNDGGHESGQVFRTSAALTARHWRGYLRSGPRHLAKRLDYGNREVFRRFRDAIRAGATLEGISAQDALDVLRLQHWALEAGAQNGGGSAERSP
jgi:predicted dehydrogenase